MQWIVVLIVRTGGEARGPRRQAEKEEWRQMEMEMAGRTKHQQKGLVSQ
jgi:hypothetical protein